ncbi:MAG: hypothetical protein ABI364_07090, partial [Caldimonas sp.]
DDALVDTTPLRDAVGSSAPLGVLLALGFVAAWLRIAYAGRQLLRRPGLRLFVLIGLALGTGTLVMQLAFRLSGPSADDDAGWLLLAALFVQVFLLAATLGQARPERLNRL